MTLTGSVVRPLPPKGGEGFGLAQVVGCQLEERLGATFGPELLASFDATVDLFDRRFDMTAGNRQSLATVLVVSHARLLVLQVAQRVGYFGSRRFLRLAFLRHA